MTAKAAEVAAMKLPIEWTYARLSEVADYAIGRTPPRQMSAYWPKEGGIPWVSIADMELFGLIERTAETVSQEAADQVFRRPPASKGTLLMSFKLTIGRTAVLGVDAYHNEAIIAIHPKAGIERDFLRFYLPTIDFATHQDRAVMGQTLNRGKIDNLPVPLPPQPEQRAIAELLMRIKAGLEVQQKTVAKLKELKAATTAKLFREGLHGEPLKQTEIGEIPQNWDVVELGSVGFATTASGGTPGRSRAEYFSGSIPWVKSGELKDDIIVRTEETLSELGLAASSAKIVSEGTLLLAMYGATAGMTGILGIPAATNQAVCALLPVRESFSPYFLQHYLVLRRRRILSERHGGAQPNISQAIVRHMLVPKAPLTEQIQIGHILSSLSDRLRVCAAEANLFRALFASTLKSVMTGQVRVPLTG